MDGECCKDVNNSTLSFAFPQGTRRGQVPRTSDRWGLGRSPLVANNTKQLPSGLNKKRQLIELSRCSFQQFHPWVHPQTCVKMSMTTTEAVSLGAITQLSEFHTTVGRFELKVTVLGQISYDVSYTWHLKYGTNGPIYKQKQTHRHTEHTGSQGRWEEGEARTGSLGLVDANCYFQNG